MATREELRNAIENASSAQKDELIPSYGQDVETILKNMTANPMFEARLCYILKLPTEAERTAQATHESALYARRAFFIGLFALSVAVMSMIVSFVAIVK